MRQVSDAGEAQPCHFQPLQTLTRRALLFLLCLAFSLFFGASSEAIREGAAGFLSTQTGAQGQNRNQNSLKRGRGGGVGGMCSSLPLSELVRDVKRRRSCWHC